MKMTVQSHYLYDRCTGVYSKPVHLSKPAAAAADNDEGDDDGSTNSPLAKSTSLIISSTCVKSPPTQKHNPVHYANPRGKNR